MRITAAFCINTHKYLINTCATDNRTTKIQMADAVANKEWNKDSFIVVRLPRRISREWEGYTTFSKYSGRGLNQLVWNVL